VSRTLAGATFQERELAQRSELNATNAGAWQFETSQSVFFVNPARCRMLPDLIDILEAC